VAFVHAIVSDVAVMRDEPAYVGRPVTSSTAANFAGAANSLLMWRHLRMIPMVCVADDTAAEAPNSITYRVRWVTSPTARYLWVGFYPFAIEQVAGSGIVQEVKGEVRATGGAQIDGDIFWRSTSGGVGIPGHGRLWISRQPDPGEVRATQKQVNSTGWVPPADLTYQGPRMLDLGSNQAADVEVVLTTQACRLYGAVVIEAFRAEVT
jgi:hypothetical protein